MFVFLSSVGPWFIFCLLKSVYVERLEYAEDTRAMAERQWYIDNRGRLGGGGLAPSAK